MKGAGPTVIVVLIILFLLFFLTVYAAIVTNEQNRGAAIGMRQLDVLRLSNTFNLLNRSLGVTWQILGVQSVFTATKDSLGCGSGNLPSAYWYRYDGSDVKDLQKLGEYVNDRKAGTNTNMHNSLPPYICYPMNSDIEGMLSSVFQRVEDVQKSFKSNGLDVTIEDPVSNMFTISNSIKILTEYNLRLSSARGSMNNRVSVNNEIYTELPRVFEFARDLVAVTLPNFESTIGVNYPPALQDPSNNFTNYIKNIKSVFTARQKSLSDGDPYNFEKTEVVPTFNVMELLAVEDNEYLFGRASIGGLVLHYILTDSFREHGIKFGVCRVPDANIDTLISYAVKQKDWSFSDIDLSMNPYSSVGFKRSEIEALVRAFVQQESNWNPNAVGSCGEAGLLQMMPGTAMDYGITRIFEGSTITSCNFEYAQRLRNAASTGDPVNIDARFDPQASVRAAVDYIYSLIDDLVEYTKDMDELKKLTIASYNAGFPSVRSIIEAKAADKDNAKYDEIKPYLPETTQEYVAGVLGYYLCYGGVIESAKDAYYYHDPATNRFFQQPFNLNLKAEDYLVAINCGNLGSQAAETYTWANPEDLACCGGVLWACNADVPDGRVLSDGDYINSDLGLPGAACERVMDPFVLQCSGSRFVPAECPYNTQSKCESKDGCYWFTGMGNGCRSCGAATSCSQFTNEDQCNSCKVNGNSCSWEVRGSGNFVCDEA